MDTKTKAKPKAKAKAAVKPAALKPVETKPTVTQVVAAELTKEKEAEPVEPVVKKPDYPLYTTIPDLRFTDEAGNVYQLDHYMARGTYILRTLSRV